MSEQTNRTVLSRSTVLVGIDDTDNASSPGTGYLAQRLLEELVEQGLARPCGATRHQLLVDPRVPYTSHNSSACLAVEAAAGVEVQAVHDVAAQFLRTRSAEGSDPGLAVVARSVEAADRAAIIDWGFRAKTQLLDQVAARSTAAQHHVLLSGHGGTEDGVIGALAAVGLHLSGSDGFFIWMDGIRAIRAGSYSLEQLLAVVPVDDARDSRAQRPELGAIIDVSPWVRPLLLDAHAVLLLEQVPAGEAASRWRTAPRDLVRQH